MGLRKNVAKIGFAVCLSWSLLAGGVAIAKEKTPRDVSEAMQWAQEALVKSGYRVNKIDSQYLLYGDDKGNYGIALARIVSTSEEYSGGYVYRVFWKDYAHDQREAMALSPRHVDKFKAALDFLAVNARREASEQDEQEFAQFQTQAQIWREAGVKPAMPESAREHQVLAEFAFKEKNADKAISEYTAALSIFPTWPEGQYNLATLAGEKNLYAVAILHMKEYLELMPTSSDAQAARDSIIIWKDQLQTALSSSSLNAESEVGPQHGRLLKR
ncbi:MAG: hypothetical protein WBW53_08640 [Terriglobales bacterium]